MRTNRNFLLVLLAGLGLAACSEEPPLAPGSSAGPSASLAGVAGPGAVYLISNAVAGNELIVFDRSADGRLAPAGTYATGGEGTGGGLGNQESVVLTRDSRRLYVVNAGSDDISAFAVERDGPRPIGSPVPSGGDQPISLAVHGDLLYALNAGSGGNISGFHIDVDGGLTPIPGSTRPLSSSSAGPAQIGFSPNGRLLVVSEKATNRISTYTVGSDGVASGPIINPSAGATPFGFNFNQRGDLIVSEAFGGAAGASTASSYVIGVDGALQLVSGAVATTQTAACWIAISQNGKYAYTTNTGSGTVSSLRIGPGAALTLLDAAAGVTGPGSAPQDAAFSPGGRFLYVRNNAGTLSAFRVEAGGALAHIADYGPLPAGTNGVAAR